ncbi:hypothetical protein HA45_19855 [Pantoea rodasii]|nr:VasL domain-containing protein [Pantoea rodasii]ORM61868.1 hypothetical protein HA45_19855 [Pantoea rodasii]
MNQVIKTGADPRTLPGYAQLREEMNKLTHPARPDVDWGKVETLTLGLFEQNGLELQSAAWFTLARAHNTGLSGLNEGLNLIDALVVHQWSVFWPLAIDARADILSVMFRRLQSLYRGWQLQGSEMLTQLIETERLLISLREALLRFGIREFAQANTLLHQVKHSMTQLQESLHSPVQLIPAAPSGVQDSHPSRVYVVYPDADEPSAMRATPSSFKSFLSGACCAMLAGALVLACGSVYRHAHQQQVAAAQALVEQQRREKQAIPLERLASWHRGMAQLENMAEQLNSLDKTKGKYLTVSELKTGIFSAMQAFNEQIPVEEQLRRYAQSENDQLNEETQTGLRLKQIMFRFQLLQQQKAQPTLD